MKPKILKSAKNTSLDTARPKTSPSSKPETQKESSPIVKPILKSALDHVERKSSTRRLSKFIDERNSALNSLQDTENKYEKLFSVQSDGILLFDAETKKILDANESACKLFGYSKEELAQLTIPELSAEPQQTFDQLEKVIKDELKKIPLLYIKPKAGGKIVTELTTGVLHIKNKSYVFAIYRDITLQLENQEAIKRKSSELEKSNQALKDFVSIASHDLQAPLRKITSFSSRLESERENIRPESMEYLERMQKTAHRMQELLDDLLLYSQVSVQTESFHNTNLEITLTHVLEDLNLPPYKFPKNIKIGSLPKVEANASQMRQLFQNLISNAIKFKKKEMPLRIDIQGKLIDNEIWQISVKDQGIGFDEKNLDRIFRPFERLHGINQYEGTGMGLAICKNIVEGHRGTITAKSQVGHGACFIFTLPAKAAF
ncbi:MAG: two-component system sensor kinase FixL [Nitrospinales bacterium]|jgi:two-component system sensor kinase FixL